MTPRVLTKQTEAQFQSAVIDYAHLRQWRAAHFRPAMIRTGRWVTPVQADGAGFPDLILVRGHRLVAAELKVGRNRATTAQLDWLGALGHVEGVEAHVWHPQDWELIERTLA